MLRRLRPRSIYDVCAALALFVALGGTAAAMNTVRSTDIVDGEVRSADVKDESLTTFDVSTFLGADVVDGTLTGADIQDFSLTTNDMAFSTLTGADIRDDSVTGNDVNEGTLNMPPTTTATFAGTPNPVTLNADGSFTKVLGKVLPAGSWAITATANMTSGFSAGDTIRDSSCELRNSSGNFIGGATDRRETPSGQQTRMSLSMNGGAQVPANGEVSLWCRVQSGFEDPRRPDDDDPARRVL